MSRCYYSFIRTPEGLFLNLAENKLVSKKTIGLPYDEKHDTPIYEVSVCRHCGQAYILGNEANEEKA